MRIVDQAWQIINWPDRQAGRELPEREQIRGSTLYFS